MMNVAVGDYEFQRREHYETGIERSVLSIVVAPFIHAIDGRVEKKAPPHTAL